MASGIAMLDLLHWASLADASSPTIFYWSQISPYVPEVLPFGLVTLVLVAVVAFEVIANRLYVRAVRDGDAREWDSGHGVAVGAAARQPTGSGAAV